MKYLVFVFITFFSMCMNELFSDKNFSGNPENSGETVVCKKYNIYKTNAKFPKKSNNTDSSVKTRPDTLNRIIMPRGFY